MQRRVARAGGAASYNLSSVDVSATFIFNVSATFIFNE
jgi:hypothetical protein